MSFEAEVIPLFIGGVSIVSILELVIGCILLRRQKKALLCLIGHALSMGTAMVYLIRCIFGNRFGSIHFIESISNSVSIGLFGVFWSVSVCFLLAMIAACIKHDERS